MKRMIFLLLLLFLLSNASSQCNSTQIDINSANLTDLDNIIWIGPSTANKILTYRQNNPFNSLDELLNLSGIGDTKLSDIKSQGLACVEEQSNQQPPSLNQEPPIVENFPQEEIIPETEPIQESLDEPAVKNTGLEPIKLNSQNIKTINENETNEPYAVYGMIGFSVLLAFLFIAKLRQRKNEFR